MFCELCLVTYGVVGGQRASSFRVFMLARNMLKVGICPRWWNMSKKGICRRKEFVEERNLSKKGILQRKGFSQRAVRFDDEDVGTFLGEAAETLPSGSRVVTARDLAASCTKVVHGMELDMNLDIKRNGNRTEVIGNETEIEWKLNETDFAWK